MDKNTMHPRMDWESRELKTAFKRFRDHAEFMFKGPYASKSEEVHCNFLMVWVGDKGRQIFSTWEMTDDEKKILGSYWTKFEEYCKPKTNVICNRYIFKTRTQKESEPFEQFVTELKTLIKDCSYPDDIQNDLVRDHIVYGVQSRKIREKLIMEPTKEYNTSDCTISCQPLTIPVS